MRLVLITPYLISTMFLSSCSTVSMCPVPLEANQGYLKWDKTKGTIEADQGGRELYINYIAARNVCGIK